MMPSSTPLCFPDLDEHSLIAAHNAAYVGIDVETTGLDTQRDELRLVQVSIDHNVRLLRSDDWHACPNLEQLLQSPLVTKVFHYAVFDCSFLWRAIGTLPVAVYCTKIASKLLDSSPEKHSLRFLLPFYLGVSIDKSHSVTNWSTELTPAQLRGAANDARWLVDLRSALEQALRLASPIGATPKHVLNQKCQAIIPEIVELRLAGFLPDHRDPLSAFDY